MIAQKPAILALHDLQQELSTPRSFEVLSELVSDFARQYLDAESVHLQVVTPAGEQSLPEGGKLRITLRNSPLCVTIERPRAFDEVDTALAELLGAVMSLAPHRLPKSEVLLEPVSEGAKPDQLQTIYNIISSAGSLRPLRPALADIHNQVARVCDVQAFFVALYEADTETISFPYAIDDGQTIQHDPISVRDPDSLVAWVVRHNVPYFAGDWESAEAPVSGILEGHGRAPRTVLWLPLRAGDEVVGAFSVQSRQPDAYDENSYRILHAIADHVAVIVKNAQLYSTMHKLVDNVIGEYLVSAALRRAIAEIGTTLELEAVLQRLLTALGEVVQYDSTSVGLLEDGSLRFYMHRPYAGSDASGVAVLRADELWQGNPLIQAVLQSRTPVYLADVRKDERWTPVPGLEHVRSWIGAPLIAGDTPLGILILESATAETYGERDAWLIYTLASHAALAIQNARLHEEVQRQVVELRTLHEASATMTANLELDSVLQTVTREIVQALSLDSCTILVEDKMQQVLRLAAHENRQVEDGEDEAHLGLSRVRDLGQNPVVRDVMERNEPRDLGVEDTLTLAEWEFLQATGLRSLLLVPLAQRGQSLGLLAMGQVRYPRHFDEREIRLARNLAAQAAVAIEHANLYSQAQRRIHELSAFHQIVLRLNSPLELDMVLEYITAAAMELIDASNLHIYLYDNKNSEFTFCSALWRDGRREPAVPHPRPDGLTYSVIESGEAIVIDDAKSHALYSKGASQFWGIEAIAGFPLKHNNQVIGAFTVTFLHPHRFTHEEILLMNLLADQASIAVENARLFTDAKRRLRDTSALVEVAKQITGNLKVDMVMQTTVQMLKHLFNARASTIALLTEDGEELVIAAGAGIKPEFQLVRMRLGNALSGMAVSRREVMYVRDTYEQENFLFFDDIVRSLLVVPMVNRDEVLGTLTVDSDQPNAFDETDIQLMTIAAAQVSIAIANARLFETLQDRAAELARAYEDLKENDRLKDELVQNVSHELRTPLTFVRGYVDLLLDGEMGELNPDQASALQIVSDKTTEITRLVADIMSLQRIDADNLVFEEFSMRELVATAVDCYRIGDTTNPSVKVSYRAICDKAMIRGDKGRLNQVLDNLIGNALKFSPTGGEIEVRLLERRDDLLVVVKDEGIGVPPEKAARIFERFYQVDGTSRRRFGGAGLGLAIAKRIIDVHGGDIWVQSKVNEGSSFYFWLPKQSPEAEALVAVQHMLAQTRA